ncbi:MAG: maturase, partial [Streptomycetaceae bacterium]|nr:maturase [Streptomycetaceae bacterium]
SANGIVGLRVPRDVIKTKCAPYLKRGKPERRNQMVNDDDHTIVRTYGAEYRGLAEYYLLAGDVHRLNRLEWVMKTSMLKTLACKHNSTVTKMADRYKTTIETPYGPRRCFEVSVEREGRPPLVARFGGIPLRRKKDAIINDRVPLPVNVRRKELITRLQAGRCELCHELGTVDVHHVAKLADLQRLGKPQPVWDQLMAKRRRKTLVVCVECHAAIHSGQPTATPTQ